MIQRYANARGQFTSRIQELLPEIRSGNGVTELALTELVQDYRTSVWEKEMFMALLGTRQKVE